jgi:hypothetical protein
LNFSSSHHKTLKPRIDFELGRNQWVLSRWNYISQSTIKKFKPNLKIGRFWLFSFIINPKLKIPSYENVLSNCSRVLDCSFSIKNDVYKICLLFFP